jgi:NAD(P)-dependent dehydrogenase (short-subunit alcohol dehydrogenase family)
LDNRRWILPDFGELTTEQFDRTFKTNAYAMFRLTKAALMHMSAGSTIMKTSSVQAYHPSPALIDYAATKAATYAFSKAPAQQVAGKGIRVNVVAPGPVWTPLQVSGGQPTEKLPAELAAPTTA